jgi:hypothetical protein
MENQRYWVEIMLKIKKYKLSVFELENEILLRYIASNSREKYSVCKNRIDDICRDFVVLFDDAQLHKVWLTEDLRLILSFFDDVNQMLYKPFLNEKGRPINPMDEYSVSTALEDILEANQYIRQRDASLYAKGTDFFEIVKQFFEAQHRHNQLLFYIALRQNIIVPQYLTAPNFKPHMDLMISMKEYSLQYLPEQCDQALVLDTTPYLAKQIKDLAKNELRNMGWKSYYSISDMNTQLRAYNQKSASIQLEAMRSTVIAHTAALEKLAELQKDHDMRQYTRYTFGDDDSAYKPKHWI